jgi:3-hydroxybutyryl-CoA dehydrogenase
MVYVIADIVYHTLNQINQVCRIIFGPAQAGNRGEVMSEQEIRTVLIAGAGSIGIGVAKSFTKAGYATQILSRNPAKLKGLIDGVEVMDKLPEQAPDLIAESIPELPDLKRRLYREIEDAYKGASIIATNTSSLPLADLARDLRYPKQFMGMHYFYPADSSEFVEVMRTPDTDTSAVAKVIAALKGCGTTPIVLNRPALGGLFNRLQHALLHEAYYLLDQGVATAEQIDDMAKRFFAPRMCITGLLEQKDISGLDTHARAQRSIVPDLSHDHTPSKCLQTLYEQGNLGLKTGKGFYDWTGADPDQVRRMTAEKVARISALMKELESNDSASK